MNYKQYAEEFWKNGYLVIEDFFDQNMMDTLNTIILDHYGLQPKWAHEEEFIEKSATEVVPWFPFQEGNNIFDIIEKDARLLALTHAILGDDWEKLYFMAMFSKQGTQGQAWHQDSPPENHAEFNLNRLFYTHDIKEQEGGQLVIFPQTHLGGAIAKGDPHENLEGQVVLSPKKGTIIFVHGHLWHRVLPISGAYRLSANSRAIPKGTPKDVTDIAVYRNMRYKFSTKEVTEER
jgi:ectoine hydroxylase-related dioxygenase (phytanoyl-CoA dioxygenase family)